MTITGVIRRATEAIDETLKEKRPSELLLLGAIASLALPAILRTVNSTPWRHLLYNKDWKELVINNAYAIAIRTPLLNILIQRTTQKEILKYEDQFEKEVRSSISSPSIIAIPERGLTPEEVLSLIPKGCAWSDPNKISGVYYGPADDSDLLELQGAMLSAFSCENPLHPELSPSLGEMERQLIQWCGQIFGLDRAYGCVTSGGTESLLLASLSAFTAGKEKGITKPNIVMPITGHSAFNKASHYFGIEIRTIPVDENGRVNPKRMQIAIDSNTILLVASAPSYAYGIIDPIEEIAKIAQKKKIPCHVDCCLGGFVLPWLRKKGDEQIPNFDFTIPGVTSLSADTHKFGYASKGSSILLYRDKDLYQKQIFTDPTWNGGMNTTPTIQGSRSGGPVASAWATMLYMGHQGYTEAAENIAYATRKLAEQCHLQCRDTIEVIGSPVANVVAFQARNDPKDIWRISTWMHENRGWNVSTLQKPPAFHFCITRRHAETKELADLFVEKFMHDLINAVEAITENPELPISGTAKAYGGTADYPKTIVHQALCAYMTAQTCTPGEETN